MALHLEELTGERIYPEKVKNFRDVLSPSILLEIKKTIGKESYRCFVDRKVIRIQGGDERGLFYGIMAFFHELGFRWYAPGKFGTVIPGRKKIKLPDNWKISGKPSIPWRGLHICGSGLTKDGTSIFHFDYETALWMIRNRMNFKPIHNDEYEQISSVLKELLLEPLAFGHSYSFWIPSKEFAKKPDFFPLIAGKRQPEGQRCLSNESLQKEISVNVIKFAEKYPDLKIISLAPNDGYKFCLCKRCLSMDSLNDRAKGETNRRNHLFAYRIAKKFKEKFPDRFLSTLSYCNYLEPGKDVPYQKNLIVSMCITKAQNRFVDDPESPSNRIFLERLRRWKKKTGGIFCSFYHLSYGGTFPRPYEKQTVYMHRFFRKEKVLGVKTEVTPGHLDEWRSAIFFMYLYAQSLYDADIDDEKLLVDFCKNFYGKPWKNCLKIYRKHSEVVNRYLAEIYQIDARIIPSLYRNKDIRELKQYAVKLKHNKGRLKDIYKKRVELLLKQVEEIVESRKGVIDAKKESGILKCTYSEKRPQFHDFDRLKWIVFRQRADLVPYPAFNGFSTLWTENMLWLCFRMKESCLRKECETTEKGNVWAHSNVDCFISTQPEQNIYFQIAVSVHNDRYIARCQGRNHDTRYPLNPVIKIQKGIEYWNLIIGIPFDHIELDTPVRNKIIKISLNRGYGCYNTGRKILGGWPYGGSWHDIETMGEMQFTVD